MFARLSFFVLYNAHNTQYDVLLLPSVCMDVELLWCSKGIFLTVIENIDFAVIHPDCTENKCLY